MPAKKPLAIIMGNNNSSHLTKAEIEERESTEIKVASDKISAPSHLSAKLKKRFNLLAEQLIEINILTNLDVECLARYVGLENQYNLITKAIAKINIVDSAEEYDKMLVRQNKIYMMLSKSSSELGLTISSRCKLVIPKKETVESTSKWNKYGNVNNG